MFVHGLAAAVAYWSQAQAAAGSCDLLWQLEPLWQLHHDGPILIIRVTSEPLMPCE